MPQEPEETRATGPETANEEWLSAARPSVDFIAFVQSLYVSALMALGEAENPETHQTVKNLALARQNIDIIAVLRDKTRGNLTKEEDALLSQMVPQLQLLYVKKAR